MTSATNDAVSIRLYTAQDVFLITVDDLQAHRSYPEPATRPTWDTLVALEPRLGRLLIEAARYAGMCWSCRWYGRADLSGLKSQVSQLVGWGSTHENDLMHTRAAYDVAYHRVLDEVRDDRCRFHLGDYETDDEVAS